LSFGISPAPEEIQRRMIEALEGLDGVKVIHDDILLYAVDDSDDESCQISTSFIEFNVPKSVFSI
jgi:hypothetical protein